MKELKVIMKSFTKEYLTEHSDRVFRNRELVIEKELGSTPDDTVYRFKIGDGISPYKDLKYVSSIYSLLPSVSLLNESYDAGLELRFSE